MEERSWLRRNRHHSRNETQRFRAGFDSKPLYTRLYNPRWSHSPEEHKLDMDGGIERLRSGILLLQPAPSPQDNLSPQQSPAVGTGSKGDARPRAGIQSTEKEGVFPLQSSLDGYTNPDQEWTTNLLQADVGVIEKNQHKTILRKPRNCFHKYVSVSTACCNSVALTSRMFRSPLSYVLTTMDFILFMIMSL